VLPHYIDNMLALLVPVKGWLAAPAGRRWQPRRLGVGLHALQIRANFRRTPVPQHTIFFRPLISDFF
jgi:hypothetical protein